MSDADRNSIVIFTTDDERVSVDVRFDAETFWLTQQQIADLFGAARSTVAEHIAHIYKEGEQAAEATCRDFRQVRAEGSRSNERNLYQQPTPMPRRP